jgi:F-type H+-transporting ATPase subunit b
MSASTALLLAADGEASGTALVLPAQAELIWGLVGFALLFIIIQTKVWPGINKTLEARRAAIEDRIADAESQLAAAERTRREYDASLSDARSEAAQIVEEARGQAERLKADVLARAEEEAAAIKARAAADAEAERGRALAELRGQVASLSTDIASKIIGAEVDQSRHDQLVDSFISQLSSRN